MADKEIGKVTHWYDKISVAVVKLTGALKTGDKIKVKHGETEFEDTIPSMQVNHQDVPSGKKGDEVAIKVSGKAKEGSQIFKVE
jgi:putative protease